MSKLQILDGDFKDSPRNHYFNGKLYLVSSGHWFREKIKSKRVAKLEVLAEGGSGTLGKTIGFAIAGASVAGPIGAAFGAMVGGKGKQIVFRCQLDDDRSFVAALKENAFFELQMATHKIS